MLVELLSDEGYDVDPRPTASGACTSVSPATTT